MYLQLGPLGADTLRRMYKGDNDDLTTACLKVFSVHFNRPRSLGLQLPCISILQSILSDAFDDWYWPRVTAVFAYSRPQRGLAPDLQSCGSSEILRLPPNQDILRHL